MCLFFCDALFTDLLKQLCSRFSLKQQYTIFSFFRLQENHILLCTFIATSAAAVEKVTSQRPLCMRSCCLLSNVNACNPPPPPALPHSVPMQGKNKACIGGTKCWLFVNIKFWSLRVVFKLTTVLHLCLIWKIPYLGVWAVLEVSNVWRWVQSFTQYLPTRWSANYTRLLNSSHAHSFMATSSGHHGLFNVFLF